VKPNHEDYHLIEGYELSAVQIMKGDLVIASAMYPKPVAPGVPVQPTYRIAGE
jgi:hypothetical protein